MQKNLQYNFKSAQYLCQCMKQTMDLYLNGKRIPGHIYLEGFENHCKITFTNTINEKKAETEISYDGLFESHQKETIHKKTIMVLERLIADAELKKG